MTDFFDSGGYSENTIHARSKIIQAPLAVGTHNLLRIPKGAFVKELWLEVTTACTAGTAIDATLGFAGNAETADPDYFMPNADSVLGTAGLRKASANATPFEGKRFKDAGAVVTLTLADGSNLTAGQFQVHIEYTMISG